MIFMIIWTPEGKVYRFSTPESGITSPFYRLLINSYSTEPPNPLLPLLLLPPPPLPVNFSHYVHPGKRFSWSELQHLSICGCLRYMKIIQWILIFLPFLAEVWRSLKLVSTPYCACIIVRSSNQHVLASMIACIDAFVVAQLGYTCPN